ncbi:hypothetical protein Pint_12292 [Pistacia integerrima]|uniref:Uncharacterized protein n=1 Tax=Pistacia integerrima TaxID=434235 RepID=A0ACC0XMM2_9ROSI|nr:hypothetical protein Pint_12292 [Pistacia integerrima]
MQKDDLAIKNGDDNTAFFLAAESGMVGFAKIMVEKNEELPSIRGGGVEEMLPIHIAAQHGHEKMMEFLHNVTKNMTEKDKKKLQDLTNGKDLFDEQEIHGKLYRAALKNEWYTACLFFEKDQEKNSKYATDIISDKEDIALHIATAAGSCGNVRRATFNKNKNLPNIRGDDGMLPIHTAAQQGHQETVKFLYGVNEHELTQEDCKDLLPHLISRADWFGIARDLLKKYPILVNVNLLNGRTGKETVLHVLARTPLMSHDLSNQNQEGLFKRCFNKFSEKEKLPHEKLPKEALELLRLLLDKVDCRDDWTNGVIHHAVRHDNIEFLSLIICNYSEFMNCKAKGDTNTSGLIFSNAILKRQKDIFKLLDGISLSFDKQILNYKDDEGNNILHLVGKLSPPEQLDAICGVALQLQQELMWK